MIVVTRFDWTDRTRLHTKGKKHRFSIMVRFVLPEEFKPAVNF